MFFYNRKCQTTEGIVGEIVKECFTSYHSNTAVNYMQDAEFYLYREQILQSDLGPKYSKVQEHPRVRIRG